VLQEFVPAAEDGWETPIDAAAAALKAGSEPDTAPYAAAGRAAGALHAALAARFGLRPADAAMLEDWRHDAEAALDAASAADASLASVSGAVRAELAGLRPAVAPLVSRIHGDLHYAQLLRAPGRLAIIDFEGDPTRPLAARRAQDTPLRDLACLLRSIDHIGSAASRRAGDLAPDRWIAAATAAAAAAYAETAPVTVDGGLLRALEVAKECSEYLYAQRVLPEWTYAPRLGLRRLLEGATP
jgi:maltokinase